MTDLDARYGHRSQSSRKIAVWSIAVLLVVAAVAWFIWAQPISTGTDKAWRDTGYAILEPSSEVLVQWELTAEPGTESSCALYSMNQAFAVVGWKVLDIPASEQRIRQFSASVLTTEAPVTGLVYRCW